jgi:hypothetical protein
LLSPISEQGDNPIIQAAHLYDYTCLGPNIEKHAESPLYTLEEIHPHPDYQFINGNYARRLKINNMNKMMQRLKEKIVAEHQLEIETQQRNWLDFCKVADIQCKCPQNIAFEKVLALQQLDQKQQAMAYNSCIHSIFAAAKRQMKRAPTPEPQIADDFVQFAKEYINKHIGDKLRNFGYSFNQWYNHNNAQKQKDIDRYLQSLVDRASFTKREYADLQTIKYKGICKVEIQPTNGKPRMVCSIPIRTKTVMGPVTWRLEEICCKHLPGYCGNKNLQQMSDEVNKLLEQGFTKIVEGDGSGFDNTQDVSLKEVDRWLYRQIEDKIYHVPKSEFHYISQQLYKTMVVQYLDKEAKKKKNLFEYSILGTVFSGDCDTTLCNTIRMALYNIYVNTKAGLVLDKDFKVWSKGDDFTIFYKPYVSNELIKSAYDKYFVKPEMFNGQPLQYGLGQILKFLTIGNADTLSFCSLRALYTDFNENKIILVRDYRKFNNISLYARKIKTMQGKHRVQYLLQQAASIRAVYKGINIFDNFAAAFEQAAQTYALQYTKDEKLADRLLQVSMNMIIKTAKSARYQCSQFAEIVEDEYRTLIYNIQKNSKFFKIQADYWETIKKMQELVSYKLTKQEYDYINQQIEAEISQEIFKSDMGLKNFNA